MCLKGLDMAWNTMGGMGVTSVSRVHSCSQNEKVLRADTCPDSLTILNFSCRS